MRDSGRSSMFLFREGAGGHAGAVAGNAGRQALELPGDSLLARSLRTCSKPLSPAARPSSCMLFSAAATTCIRRGVWGSRESSFLTLFLTCPAKQRLPQAGLRLPPCPPTCGFLHSWPTSLGSPRSRAQGSR